MNLRPHFRKIIPVSCLFLSAINGLFAQSTPTLRRYDCTHPQMGTLFKLSFYADADSTAEYAKQAVFARVDSLNAIMSDYLPESELNRLCATAGSGRHIPVSPDLWHILRLADHFSRESQGAFDITAGALTRLWRRSRNLKTLPDSSRIKTALSCTGFALIRFYDTIQSVELLQAGMQLDLGGIAQGFAADECLRMLKKWGITAALADAGGDIAVGEPPPGMEGWEIEIPDSSGVKRLFQLKNCGITTSGAQYRYLEVDGVRYSHIIDPRTGWAMTHHNLVTVRAPNAVSADAWATALSVEGAAGWARLSGQYADLEVWIQGY